MAQQERKAGYDTEIKTLQDKINARRAKDNRSISDIETEITALQDELRERNKVKRLNKKVAAETKQSGKSLAEVETELAALKSELSARKRLEKLRPQVEEKRSVDGRSAAEIQQEVDALKAELKQFADLKRLQKNLDEKLKNTTLSAYERLAETQRLRGEIDKLNAYLRIVRVYGRKIETVRQATIKKLRAEINKLSPTIVLPQSVIDDVLSQTTDEGFKESLARAYIAIAEQMPASWIEKINAWRYMSMLANPRTWSRNIIGNALMVPVRMTKNAIKATIESRMNPENRTAAFINRWNAEDRKLIDFAEKDANEMKDIISGGGKLNPTNAIQEQRKIFKSSWLEWIRTGSFNALEKPDWWFLKPAYKSALAQYMKAKHLTADTITAEQLTAARQHATQEAKVATFRQASEVARVINNYSQNHPIWSIAIEGILPFKKTPINILKTGTNYSPIGLIRGFIELPTLVKSGKITADTAIDHISSGLTGTGVMLLGWFLAHLGVLAGGDDDNDKAQQFYELTGGQNYALKIGDFSLTLDWAAPAAMPLFIGAELDKYFKSENKTPEEVISAFAKITEPAFNMTMLQGIDSAIRAASYSKGSAVTAILANSAENYLTQFIPSVVGAIARTIDPTRRSTRGSETAPFKSVDAILRKIGAKIPGVSFALEPYVDQWGRETDSGSTLTRLAENMLIPGYISTENVTSVDKEISRLYSVTDSVSVLPGYAPTKFTVDNKEYELSASNYTAFAKIRGQTAYDTVNELIYTRAYRQLSDDHKVDAIEAVYSYANKAAQSEFAKVEYAEWLKKAVSSKLGYTVAQVIAYRTLVADITPNYDARGNAITGTGKTKKIQALQKAGMSYADAAKFYETYLS